nr:HEAT repeat domain-containing protein [Candidatus Freyarchaeota archaeon]
MGKSYLSKNDIKGMKAEKDVEGLIKALKDMNQSEYVREAAANALGDLKDLRAIKPLLEVLLKDKYAIVISKTTKSLKKIGESAVEPLIQALKDDSVGIRIRLVKILGEIGDKRAVEPLIAVLRNGGWSEQRAAAKALGKIKNGQTVDILIQALRNECLQASEERVRHDWYPEEIVRVLGWLGESAVEPLVRTLRDENWRVRSGAGEALKIIGWYPRDDTEKVLFLIGKEEWDKVTEVGESSVELIIHFLKDKNWLIRRGAAYALGKIGDKRGVEPLIQALKDESFDVRDKAIWALAKMGESAVEPLMKALEDKDWHVRWGATQILGEIKDKQAIKPLEQALRDGIGEVRMAASIALAKIEKKGTESLDQTLKNKSGMDEFERINLIEQIINNYAKKEGYSTADFHYDYQRFNPVDYERVMQKIGDNPNISIWDYKWLGDFFKDAVKELFNYMKNGEKKVRLRAMQVFADAQQKTSYTERLYDEEYYETNKLDEEKYWDFFVEAMGEEDTEIREVAKKAVKNFSRLMKIPRLYPLLESENPNIKRGAREELADVLKWVEPSEELLKHAIEAASQEDDDIRQKTASRIIRIYNQFEYLFAEELTNNPNEWIREFSAEMLRHQMYEYSSDEAMEALIKAIGDPSPKVRKAVAETMGVFYSELELEPERWPDPEENPFSDPLVNALGDEDQSVREAALEALAILGVKDSSLDKIAEALKNSVEAESIKDAKPIELFLKLLNSEKWHIRRLAILSLGYLKDPAIVNTLKNYLNDKDSGIREAAVQALSLFPRENVLETLRGLLNDTNTLVRKAAEKAISK